MPPSSSRRALVCGAVLLLACTAIVAHAADAPAAANKPAANKPAANAAANAAKPAAAANKPAAANAPEPAKAKSSSKSSDSGKRKASHSADDDDPTPDGKDKYDKYETGSGSDKGAKLKWKYLSPTIDAICTNPGQVCAPGICDVVQIECAPGSVCTPICNGCQATCAAPLTCTGGGCFLVFGLAQPERRSFFFLRARAAPPAAENTQPPSYKTQPAPKHTPTHTPNNPPKTNNSQVPQVLPVRRREHHGQRRRH